MNDVSQVDEKILKCIDTALEKLGESVPTSIFYYLKRDFGLERFEIPKKPEVFEKALTSIFGKRGAKVVEKLILVEIRKNFNIKKGSSSTFKRTVENIRKSGINSLEYSLTEQ